MHFITLATVEIPKIQADSETDRQIAETLETLMLQKQLEPKDFMLDIAIERCHSLQSAFSRAVNSGIVDKDQWLLRHSYSIIRERGCRETDCDMPLSKL